MVKKDDENVEIEDNIKREMAVMSKWWKKKNNLDAYNII